MYVQLDGKVIQKIRSTNSDIIGDEEGHLDTNFLLSCVCVIVDVSSGRFHHHNSLL